MDLGIVIISHSQALVQGLADLLAEVAQDISLTFVGGTEDGQIGTSFDQVQKVIDHNDKSTLLAFYDLGSARMNLEMVADFSDKEILIQDVALVEGVYTAAALLQAGADYQNIEPQLEELKIKK